MDADPEQATVRAFVIPERRDRWLQGLRSRKQRTKITDRLPHCDDFEPRHMHRVPKGEQTPSGVFTELTRRGAPSVCHIISEDNDIDGKDLPLDDALADVVGRGYGTLLICLPGRLAYYESEEQYERYILDNRS
ncbi:MAG TPA: hypothetical protein VK988_03915 [Acidimicrobiales bacterium]|nr:hypothetical protein [Acidimicrobiales bacterium]